MRESESERDPLSYLSGWEETEASRILLNTAIVVRNSIEADGLVPGGDTTCSVCLTARRPFEGALPNPVPRTLRDLWNHFVKNEADEESLGIRETCHKIVHATRVEWDRSVHRKLEHPLTGRLFLFGEKPERGVKLTWLCRLRVDDFCLNTIGLY